MQIMGFDVFSNELSEIKLESRCVINTINPHSYIETKKNSNFKSALLNSDILLPDGIGIVYAARILNRNRINKIAGYDIHLHILKNINERKGSCFYLGSSEENLFLLKEKIIKNFPNIKIYTHSPPFKDVFSDEDDRDMIDYINKVSPDVLFVGLTAPKQELWVDKNKNKIDANIIASIGAVFDFYSGNKKRSNRIWIKLGLEWLPRLIKEPRRLWKRNFISTPLFIIEIIKYKFFRNEQ